MDATGEDVCTVCIDQGLLDSKCQPMPQFGEIVLHWQKQAPPFVLAIGIHGHHEGGARSRDEGYRAYELVDGSRSRALAEVRYPEHRDLVLRGENGNRL